MQSQYGFSQYSVIFKSIGDSTLSLGVIVRVDGWCESLAMDLQPVQGVVPAFTLCALGQLPADSLDNSSDEVR